MDKKEMCIKVLKCPLDIGSKLFKMFFEIFLFLPKFLVLLWKSIKAFIALIFLLFIVILVISYHSENKYQKEKKEAYRYYKQGFSLYHPFEFIEDNFPIKKMMGMNYAPTKNKEKIQKAIGFLEKSLEFKVWKKDQYEYYAIKGLIATMYSKLDGIENQIKAIEIFEEINEDLEVEKNELVDYMEKTAEVYEQFGDCEKAIEINTKILNLGGHGVGIIAPKYWVKNKNLKSKLEKNKNFSYVEYKKQKEAEAEAKANIEEKEYRAKLTLWNKIWYKINNKLTEVLCAAIDTIAGWITGFLTSVEKLFI